MKTTSDSQLLFDSMRALPERSALIDTDLGTVSRAMEAISIASAPEPANARIPAQARRRTHGKQARMSDVPDAVSAIERLLTFAEAAKVLGISLRQFRRLVDAGKVAFVKVSERAPRVRPSELQRFLHASAVKYSEVSS